MKRTFTLGLLVFFLGVMITACGSKKSSAPATSNTNTNTTNNYNNYSQVPSDCSGQCSKDYSGTFTISNIDLYAAAFNYTGNGNGGYQIGVIEPILNSNGSYNSGFLGSLGYTLVNGCLMPGIFAWLTTRLTGADSSAQCTIGNMSTTNVGTGTGQTGNTALSNRYNADLQVNYRNNALYSVVMMVRTGSNGGNGDIAEFFPRANSNYLYNNTGNLALELTTSGINMHSQSGLIGVYQ